MKSALELKNVSFSRKRDFEMKKREREHSRRENHYAYRSKRLGEINYVAFDDASFDTG